MTEVKKVLFFGSTGRIGSGGMVQRLAKEFDLSVFVRTPSKIPEEVKDKVNVIQGDAFNAEQVEKAIEGHDAVVSTIGQHRVFGTSNTATDSTKNILTGMKKKGVSKVIVINVPFGYHRGTINHAFMQAITSIGDHARQLDALKAEKDLSWVAIATPWVKYLDKINPAYMVALGKDPGVNEVTSGELADFMVKILKSDEEYQKYHQGSVGISSKPKKKWFS